MIFVPEFPFYLSAVNTAQFKTDVYRVIFGNTTKAGRAFDVALFWLIALSVFVVLLESVPSFDARFHLAFRTLEWIFTILFTLEYLLRIYSLRKPSTYIFSFYGIIDLLAILPSYLAFFVAGSQMLMTVRILRLLRIFRVMGLTGYQSEGSALWQAVLASRRKISVFLFAILLITVISGTLMYLVEGPEHGFTSIPRGIYWSIVTLTTVGYGDISPVTAFGQALASLIMIMGYGIIAVPTGIVTAEMAKLEPQKSLVECENCKAVGHPSHAKYCHACGEALPNQ